MKIAVGSDMKSDLTDAVVEELRKRDHEVEEFGALVEKKAMWSKVALEVAEEVADGEFDQAVLFCWTGTGISLAANKVKGVRAVLCWDAPTAAGARQWNDANILCMSIRAVSAPVAMEILEAWFSTSPSTDEEDVACWEFLNRAEEKMM